MPLPNLVAVLVAAVSAFLVGGLWYSALFAKRWAALVGIGPDQQRKDVPRIFATAFICELVAAANLAFFIGPHRTAGFGAVAGVAAGIGWVGMAFGVTHAFERRPLALTLIDAGYHAVALTVMGAILGAWS